MYISSIQDTFQRERDAKETTKEDMLAFIGIRFLSGVKKQSHTTFKIFEK